MKWTDEKLKFLEELGKAQFSIKQVAIVMEVSHKDFAEVMEDEDSPVFKAYWKGRLLEEMAQRNAVLELAKGGSSAAQALAKSYIDEAKVSD